MPFDRFFSGWEGSPTKIDYGKKCTLILTSTGGPRCVCVCACVYVCFQRTLFGVAVKGNERETCLLWRWFRAESQYAVPVSDSSFFRLRSCMGVFFLGGNPFLVVVQGKPNGHPSPFFFGRGIRFQIDAATEALAFFAVIGTSGKFCRGGSRHVANSQVPWRLKKLRSLTSQILRYLETLWASFHGTKESHVGP